MGDGTETSATARYDERPWLARYGDGVPADLELPFPNAAAMVADAVRREPDRPLVEYFGTTLTVAEVDRLSAAVAAGLAADCGVRRGDRVAVHLQNVPGWVLALVAAWRLGAVVVPVSPMLKRKDIELILRDSGASVLVTLEDLHGQGAGEAASAVGVEHVVTTSGLDWAAETPERIFGGRARSRPHGTLDLRELIDAHDGERPDEVDLGPDDFAFITYTSGTTGPPKGATNTHRNVVHNANVYRTWMSLGADDRVLAAAPLFHITGLIAHLAVGLLVPIPIVLGFRFDPAVMAELAERHRTTFTVASITAFIAMMNDEDAAKRDLSSMTKVYSGGAPIAPGVVKGFQQTFGPYIHNIYGLTETTSPSHGVPMGTEAPVDSTSGALSVGVPVCNTVVRIVGDDDADLPYGEIGEIVTEGPCVVPGYWEKPEETEAAIPGGRLHTGDVGFMDAEGWFYIVDRKKDQINVSGYKVWPREVEDALYEHPDVKEAAVVGVPDEYRGETVKAYVSLKAGASATPEDLIAFTKEHLASYKYPRQVEILDEIPKTATGKMLRRELREKARAT